MGRSNLVTFAVTGGRVMVRIDTVTGVPQFGAGRANGSGVFTLKRKPHTSVLWRIIATPRKYKIR
jgi:hypothetical protein